MAKVIIELEFDDDNVTDIDVYKYLSDILEDGCLNWTLQKE